MPWIVAHTKPCQELIAELNLKRQGYEYYCPKILDKRPKKSAIIRPLFPRYIFIAIDQVWHSITGTRGIYRVLLGDGSRPQAINSKIIENLKAREENGFVQLTEKPRFIEGDKVKLDDGPMAGHILVYQGMTAKERVKVLADFLGRKVCVEVDPKLLIAA